MMLVEFGLVKNKKERASGLSSLGPYSLFEADILGWKGQTVYIRLSNETDIDNHD